MTVQSLEPVRTRDGLLLPLARIASVSDRGSVLLLHGASAGSDTFLTPERDGLAAYLASRGLDVWLLDWRASPLVTERFAPIVAPSQFTLDAVTEHDFTAALSPIRATLAREGRRAPLSVVAHCLGAAAFSMAIAANDVARAFQIESVVLLTIGLFYRQSVSGFIKAEDHVLERVDREDPNCLTIHPRASLHPWPATLESAFRLYPRRLLPGCGIETCERLSFMFGRPYHEPNLSPEVHALIPSRFGAIHRTLFMHCGQNVRRGVAARFGDPVTGSSVSALLDTDGFKGLKVTLITGSTNTLWHRDSIDRMHEYLRRVDVGAKSTKHIVGGYSHQDLLWGAGASRDVFPLILEAIGGPSKVRLTALDVAQSRRVSVSSRRP